MRHGGVTGLERVSSFVLQVLPAVLSGLIGLFILAAALFDWRPDAPYRTPVPASPPALDARLPRSVREEHDKARARVLRSVRPTTLAENSRR
jgi:L-lactate permease